MQSRHLTTGLRFELPKPKKAGLKDLVQIRYLSHHDRSFLLSLGRQSATDFTPNFSDVRLRLDAVASQPYKSFP